jgi:superfamily I DNA/RNA helicase
MGLAQTLRRVEWTTRVDPARLRAERFAQVSWEELRRAWVQPAKTPELNRTSLANPAAELRERYITHERVAVLDVRLDAIEDLQDLHRYVLALAASVDCRLIVQGRGPLAALAPQSFVDPGFGYGWTVERARYLCDGAAPHPIPLSAPEALAPLDAEQLRAVAAGRGVVQVIAPAGSGKTTVLVERVRELLRRGADPGRILCLTFNKAAAGELQQRLAANGAGAVTARTFHGQGWRILREAKLLRPELRTVTAAQWYRLVSQARDSTDPWLDPHEAQEEISRLKLAELVTPTEWAERAPPDDHSRLLARLYSLYERQLEESGARDFDDLVFLAVRALRESEPLRRGFQAHASHVLVDEYQDTEPAQELLVQILAAPEDDLFCVGDEDQTLYAWRRASVERMVGLDQTYPWLERVALETNYRCPPDVVERSAALIANNELRFPKRIRAGRTSAGPASTIEVEEHDNLDAQARAAADRLVGAERGEIVVLARTIRLLRSVARACVPGGIKISAPEQIFEARGAEQAIEAYMRLLADPRGARPEDVETAFRMPNRGLPYRQHTLVAERLRLGESWNETLANIRADARQREKLDEAALLFESFAAGADAAAVIRQLRSQGGLDRYLGHYEQLAGAEQSELETLDDLEREAQGKSVHEFAAELDARRDALLAIRDDEEGLELATIHGAKGRQWPQVIVVGVERDQLPHKRALEAGEKELERGEGIEAERRLAYVALTRAQASLTLLATRKRLSQFVYEAGLIERPPTAAETPARGSRRGQRPLRSQIKRQLGKVEQVSVGYAVRASPSTAFGLAVAVVVVRERLAKASTLAGDMTISDLLGEVPELSHTTRMRLMGEANVFAGQRLRDLDRQARERLATVLEQEANSHR